MVVMEALASGLPVVCHDACGMGNAVTQSCGIKIPLECPEVSVAGFSDALRRLLTTPDLLTSLSAGAIGRSRELTWDEKARQIAMTYQSIPSDLATRDEPLYARGKLAC